MTACPSCGRENPDDARFCNSCGSELTAPAAAREVRKIVTVLFADVVGSTALGESTDPEALRARMRSYFDDLRTIVERHGGTVEKFVGDAVMAVFGIPVAYEDDALRAVRAAAEMRVAVSGHGLEARIGVNTGEVVTGGVGETLVTGDAVNVAARLEQAAPPGDALIGSRTLQLVRDAVQVEAVEPLQLKGKSEPVQAFRLVEVLPDVEGLARHPQAPLVGRARERERLRRDFEDVVAERTCRLFTLLGPAGIGKSRLVADFLEGTAEEAEVLRGRCLHYGEGITYWPLVEILVRLGVAPETVIGSSPEETRLAFRRLLEARARERPQVVVVDDLQWAEPTFLDLIEHVADFSRDAPILLLCVARTELLDLRPGWGGGKMNATSILLEPLGGTECDALMENLLGGSPLDEDTRERIAAASEGNPLFVEEMLAMVREQGGDGEIVVPPTIHALLQARLDGLDRNERVVIERGSVEGQVFHRGSVALLAPDPIRLELESHLSTLVRKELIRPDRSAFPDDDAFRFRHLLIRDAAYESLPKATRAELHERFADWLSGHDLVERDEILGYHLEQAHRYRRELDDTHPKLAELAARAAEHLGPAGRSALDRGDFNAGRSLLSRAVNLLPGGDERRLALIPDYAVALWESDKDDAWEVLEEALHAADPVTRALALVTASSFALGSARDTEAEQRSAWREEARVVFAENGHDYGLALYWWSVSTESWFRCRARETAEACERALAHLEAAGAAHTRLAHPVRGRLLSSYVFAPTHVDEAIERVEAVGAGEFGPLRRAWEGAVLGRLYSMRGEFERARELARGAMRLYLDAGLLVAAGGVSMSEAETEVRCGDLAAAEGALREGIEVLERAGDRGYYPTAVLNLAAILYNQGRVDEVQEWLGRARATTGADDVVNFVFLDMLEGCLLARQGQLAVAEQAGRRAVDLAETTDFFDVRAKAHRYLAETLALAGKRDDAVEHGRSALGLLEAKGDIVSTARYREQLARVGVEAG